jgi:cell division protein FtsW
MIGSVSIVLVFLIFILTGLEISKAATGFSSNLALAMVTIIGAQAFINISAITALVPLTGIPLSFISYGGSSLITMASATGIIVNISKTYDRQ